MIVSWKRYRSLMAVGCGSRDLRIGAMGGSGWMAAMSLRIALHGSCTEERSLTARGFCTSAIRRYVCVPIIFSWALLKTTWTTKSTRAADDIKSARNIIEHDCQSKMSKRSGLSEALSAGVRSLSCMASRAITSIKSKWVGVGRTFLEQDNIRHTARTPTLSRGD